MQRLLLLLLTLGFLQPVPQDAAEIRYHKASAELNQAAAKELTTLFKQRNASAATGMTARVLMCGPGLWSSIKGVAPQPLRGAMPITANIPDGNHIQVLEGKGFKTKPLEKLFWQTFFSRYGAGKAKVRNPTAEDLKFYWAFISMDYEEPLYIVEQGKNRFFVLFVMEAGRPAIFSIDRLEGLHLGS
jgi:hypothetical protein